MSNFVWTVPGYAISNFVVAVDSSSGIVVSNFSTTRSNVFFYWVDGGGNRVIKCTATFDGKTVVGKTTLNVLRPIAGVTATTGSIGLDDKGVLVTNGVAGTNIFGLHYGIVSPFGIPGITFVTNLLTLPSGAHGHIEWVQLVNSASALLQTSDGIWHTIQQIDSPMLDTVYPYDAVDVTTVQDSSRQSKFGVQC